jgi:hypothetical protein
LCEIRKDARDICTTISRIYGGEAMKSHMFLSSINSSKRVARMWKMMKEVVIQDLIQLMKML